MIECTNAAYQKITDNPELLEKIIKGKDRWEEIFWGRDFSGDVWKIFDTAEAYFKDLSDPSRMDRRLKEAYLDILDILKESESEGYSSWNKEKLLVEHPVLLAYSVIGKDILKPEKYGFSSIRQLEESVSAFCIGERFHLDSHGGSRYHVWRNGKYKNEFTNGEHGDFFLSQTDTSGYHETLNTLFGTEEKFETWKDTEECTHSLYEFQNWMHILMITLRYAEAVGKGRIPEIVNWKELESKLDGFTPATSEAMFGSGVGDYQFDMLAKNPLAKDGQEMKTFPLYVSSRTSGADEGTLYIPVLKGNKLVFLREDKKGKIKIFDVNAPIGKTRFSPHMEYEESDIVSLLTGIYKLYSRDKRELPKVIDAYLRNPQK